MNSGDNAPSELRTCSLSPDLTFLPAFFPINLKLGDAESLVVFCDWPLINIFAPSSKLNPLTKSFLPLTEVPVILGGAV